MTGSTDPEGYAQICEVLTGPDHVDPDYGKIKCPTCVIGGRLDGIAPLEVTEELHALISKSGTSPYLSILEAGHMQIIEDIEGVAMAIRRILSYKPVL